MNKKPFTLIEVIVAAFLCSLIFTVLIQGYIHIQKQKIENQGFHEQAYLSQRIYFRLSPVFSRLAKWQESTAHKQPPKILLTKKFPFASGTGLECTFDNGIDPHPQFCNLLIGNLYLDSQQKLYWKTINREEEEREEILCEGVQTLNFLFFDPETKKWDAQCKISELEKAPKMIKIQIALKENRAYPLEWVFFTHLRNEPIAQ